MTFILDFCHLNLQLMGLKGILVWFKFSYFTRIGNDRDSNLSMFLDLMLNDSVCVAAKFLLVKALRDHLP